MEGDEEDLAQWTLSQISDKANAKISIKECGDAMVMAINSKLAGVPFTIEFFLKVMTSQDVSIKMYILDQSSLSFNVYSTILYFALYQ
jgi:hypothetical protein